MPEKRANGRPCNTEIHNLDDIETIPRDDEPEPEDDPEYQEDDFLDEDEMEVTFTEEGEPLVIPATKKPKKPRAPKAPKKPEPAVKRKKDLLEAVPVACEICNPSGWPQGCLEFFKIGTQTDLDQAYSTHKSSTHGESSMYKQEMDYYKNLKIKYPTIPECIKIDDTDRVPCPYDHCNSNFTKSNHASYRIHMEYHDILTNKNMDYRSAFPCLSCPYSCNDYHALRQHEGQSCDSSKKSKYV